ncbi:response regulator transcription factor [Methylomicrobium lacus]|uniref:response regulator transcription factor n=1 Tax=Methylomicrobium lacus TaxID=136992 RepID=UPI00045EA89E|nr:response regulator transcription factor [Methylomicrobium lacus]
MDDVSREKIRILVLERHEIVRIGLRTLLENQPKFQVVAESNGFDDIYRLTSAHTPDVILLDLLLVGEKLSPTHSFALTGITQQQNIGEKLGISEKTVRNHLTRVIALKSSR